LSLEDQIVFCNLLAGFWFFISLQARAAPQATEPQVISGARIIFFSPTHVERDSIARAEGLEIDDLLDDFALSSGRAAVYAAKLGIAVEYTDSPVILVRLDKGRVRPFDRKNFSGLVGMILTDGVREPQLLPGGESDRELIAAINEFFRVK
jgi:hypothetical protein